ncbi:N-acetylmuramoyl-L-alanine amidase [Halobacillus shinanisalinarum]|uniref:N-acetylmuramoyl-L-alanine amidase n=1 Tax=Halobacillus shinanisalinarum TaxID=2932258 RepID=A0ABY4H621_9BACI|nr:N-acetylmuramoyl-L-alanine amidase [Halobacillus shinanisalinarum]UOQ95550.1 N-acetylmuramoyl-L-alanine amidase [Halobacillus shinanisalinarum]
MAYLIALDDGHGLETPGKRTPYIDSLGRSIKENEFNRAVVSFLEEELQRSGFDTLLVAPTDDDTSLSARTTRANDAGADAYISVHYNAFDGSFDGSNPSGIELYVYPGHLNREAGLLANSMAKHLREGTPQDFRGVKEANFHVLRETAMIAVLTENGFMDHPDEALLMIDPEFQREVAIEHAKGICDYFGINYVPGYIGRRVESIYQGDLRFYNQPSWSDSAVAGYLQYGYGFPNILDRVLVDGSPQYKVENSEGAVYYVTANETYVRVV